MHQSVLKRIWIGSKLTFYIKKVLVGGYTNFEIFALQHKKTLLQHCNKIKQQPFSAIFASLRMKKIYEQSFNAHALHHVAIHAHKKIALWA